MLKTCWHRLGRWVCTTSRDQQWSRSVLVWWTLHTHHLIPNTFWFGPHVCSHKSIMLRLCVFINISPDTGNRGEEVIPEPVEQNKNKQCDDVSRSRDLPHVKLAKNDCTGVSLCPQCVRYVTILNIIFYISLYITWLYFCIINTNES